MVFDGITEEIKEVEFKVTIELSESDRRKYIWNYLHLPENFLEASNSTQILKQVVITFGITIRPEGTSARVYDKHLILKQMRILNTQGKWVTILSEDSEPNKLRVSAFTKDDKDMPKLFAYDYEKADNYLEEASVRKRQLIDKEKLQGYQNLFQYDFIVDFQNQLKFIKSSGEIEKRVPDNYLEPSKIDEAGKNLVNLMNTMYHNNHTRFREISNLCKRIFPEIIDIHPRKHVDNTTSILIKKKNQSSEIDLTYEASGIDQLFRIIWIMATSKKDVIWFLDEPELHLHPGAQKLLYDFLKDEVTSGKQVFVATQSMVFIHKSELNEVSIILNRDNLYISSLEELVSAEEEITSETQNTIRDQIYMALGYEPRFSFEPEKIVVVEGKSDGHILSIFSEKLGHKLDPRTISFVPLGDRHHVEKYSPVLAYTLSNKKCLIILDNDRKDPQTTMNSILQKEKEFKRRIGDRSTLSESNFYLYPSDVYSLEHYLLHPESIYKAASNILNKAEKSVDNSLLENIRDKIEESTSNKIKIDKPKEIIKNVWETFGLGNYDEVETGVEIAKCLPEQYLKDNSQIVKLVESIKL